MDVPMCPVKSISAEHKDLIHDVAFDFYGKRMATCSSDQSVKVWDLGENGEWQCTANWRTHGGSVWRVTWGHPEFGQVLASCSFDRTTVIWEEIVGDSNSKQKIQGHWVKRTTFVDSRTSVTDVKFAPKHLGLQVATCSADGIVRFYEAPDVMNLSVWSSVEEEINTKMAKCSCISWNPSRVHPPMVAVGSNNPNPSGGGKVLLFEYSQAERKWNKVETLMNITEAVHDVAFAPNLGRSYHTLAVASKDVKITTLKPLRSEHTGTMAGATRLEVCQSGVLEHENRQVWRISWNITGTILASSSDDGFVRLWKANYLENWKCIQTLKGDGQYMKPFGTASNQMLAREQEETTRPPARGWLL